MARREDLTTDDRLRDELLWARRGTAFFARKLNELPNDDLPGPSLLPGWTRNHVVAHVGYNARAIARLMEWANTGTETPMYSTPGARQREIELGATLAPRALRHLSDHASVALNVSWRDTPDEAWSRTVTTAQGRRVPASETVWMRSREVWLHAVDLDNGAKASDIPRPILRRLLDDILAAWRRRGEHVAYTLRASDDDWRQDDQAVSPEVAIEGTLAGLVRWATGRGDQYVSAVQGHGGGRMPIPAAPHWI